MEKVKIKTDYITLGQFMKHAGIIDSGAMAKLLIQDSYVSVNGEVETRRGRKLHDGDIVTFEDKTYMVVC